MSEEASSEASRSETVSLNDASEHPRRAKNPNHVSCAVLGFGKTEPPRTIVLCSITQFLLFLCVMRVFVLVRLIPVSRHEFLCGRVGPVGKTSVLMRFLHPKQEPGEYEPTLEGMFIGSRISDNLVPSHFGRFEPSKTFGADEYEAKRHVGGTEMSLTVTDTSGLIVLLHPQAAISGFFSR
jgi:hypothetical protein